VDGRFDDRLAAVPDGWATASSHALTTWRRSAGILTPVTGRPHDEAVVGPLTWLTRAGILGWGPLSCSGQQPSGSVRALLAIALADEGEGAAREFDLATGAVAGDVDRTFVSFRRRQSRVRGAPTRGDTVRSAIVDTSAGSVVEYVAGAVPTAVAWGDGPLVLGHPGRVRLRRDGSWSDHDLPGPTAARAVCTAADAVIAGTAAGVVARIDRSGNVTTWPAHQGPVTALSVGAAPELIVSGGSDGMIRVWSDGDLREEFAAGSPVDAVAGPVDGAVAALIGGSGGSLVILKSESVG
jgi:hypothetical protein